MTAHPPDAVADLYKLVAELEQRLESSFAAHDEAIARLAATAQENAQLRNELGVARERQEASADILGTIANASGDAAASLQRIAETTARLFDAASVAIRIAEGNEWGLSIRFGAGPERIAAQVPEEQRRVGGRNLPGTVFRENRQIHIPDLDNIDPEMADWPVMMARAAGTRTVAGTPLRREGKAIGALIVYRDHLAPFTGDELALQQSFADQAAIAIENARLFNETREALSRQTATADILRVISQSPTDVQPVFDAIVLSAVRLLGCDRSFVLRCDGVSFWTAARAGPEGPLPIMMPEKVLIDPEANFPSRAIAERKTLHLPDWSVIDLPEFERRIHETLGYNSTVYLPLLREGECIGLLGLARKHAGVFDENGIALAESFRDQALIAIENTRLFNETREALERQTATSDILKVIASSPSDVQPVFDVIVERAVRLCGARMGRVYRYDGDLIHLVGGHGLSVPGREGAERPFPRPASDDTIVGRVMLSRRANILADLDEDDTIPALSRQMISALAARSQVTMPMLLAGEPIGAITLSWAEPRGYTDQTIALLQTFADQAVIAIENVRLFNETREALERQTATAEILKVIASSPSDVRPVFEAIVDSAKRLLGGFSAAVFRFIDGIAYLEAITPTNPAADEVMKNSFPRPVADFSSFAIVQGGKIVQVPDTEALSDDIRDIARGRGFRSMLLAPLMSSGTPIGLVSVTRVQPGTFAAHHEQLLLTFADQAVIAIENVRLFNEVQQRTEDLSESLQQQTAVGDVLKIISRSTFDLQPVLDTLVNTAAILCDAEMAFIMRRAGDVYRPGASVGYAKEYIEFLNRNPISVNRGTMTGRVALDRRTVHVLDVAADPEYTMRESVSLARQHTALGVPLLRENEPIGVIVLARQRVEPFTHKQIDLVTTFADQAVIAIENVRLFDELRQRTEDLGESLQQQTATADVLKVISRSAFDLQTVLNTLTESAARLCNADMAAIARQDADGSYYHATNYNFSVDWVRVLNSIRIRPERGSLVGRVLLTSKAVQIPDVLVDPEYTYPDIQKAAGYRTLLGVPLLRGKEPIGVLFLGHKTVQPFTEKQVELVSTFADQAVIAIENVRLFDEVQAKTRDLTEALTYQTGSGKILSVIASSPTEVGPVLDAIVESACELCEAYDAVVLLKEGDDLRFSAHHGPIAINIEKWPISRGWTAGRAFLERKPVHVRDMLSDEGAEFPDSRELSRHAGTAIGTVLSVPLLSENESIGTILLRRTEVQSFSDKQVALLQTFADQAVIAIGNARLFDEVQAKTRDLSEALTYQTGSANILRVIASSPTDVGPVLKAIVESSCELCGAYDAVLRLKDGDILRMGAHHGPIPVDMDRWTINRGWTAGRAVVDQRPVHVHDLLTAEGDDFPEAQARARTQGHRTVLSVPLMRKGESIGAITLRRTEVNPFGDKQINLLQTFADQAVIAIGNVRLFEEVQAKTRDLSESLQFQTASSEVLKVISSSPDTLQPVLDAIVQTSRELCGSDASTIFLIRDDKFHFTAVSGDVPKHLEYLRDNPASIDEPLFGRLIRERRTLHFANVMDDPELSRSPRTVLGGPRALLVAPLLRDGEPLGAIVLRQSHLKPFTPRQIQAIEVFADQAVIAISNVELFEEVQAKTRDLSEALTYQTGSANILKVIASSPTDVKPVLKAIVESACELCEANDALATLRDGDDLLFQAQHGSIPVVWDRQPINRQWVSGRAVIDRQPVHVHDLLTSEGEGFPGSREFSHRTNVRTVLSVPLLREGESIGAIVLRRTEVRPFSDKQIALLQTFADQAVIAIGNVRLFEEVQQRTRQLAASLDDLRTAQDRLIQTEKLASLGQLTAGIAHEIKNPLNFVNNFAALSSELTDELNDALKLAEISGKIREEVDELTGLLKDNLEKVVQHGKRADSIVKNMLLHSREGSGDHRPADINALVDESLNLAYHGARAEKPDFNITLQRDFDANAGMIDVFPQEITRVFLNLVSNGFYAVTRRKREHGPGFDPVLSAATRDLGDAVEIRIRDNGTGIPPEVKDKMFNPFFTTKPAGEGTGLGLSMSHDIIVKQHGGTIDVATEPGQFTEFRIVLPRTSNPPNKTGG